MKPYATAASFVFTIVSIVQLLRIALRWPVTIDGVDIPLWVSVLIFIVTAVLAVMVRREARGTA